MDGLDTTLKKCDYCTFSFVGHAKYYNHARKDHSDIVSQTWEGCSKCSKRFPDKKALDKHCDRKHRHEKHVCHVCCKEYVSKYRYILHANEKHKDMIKDNWEQCKTCLICYPDMKTLENHQQSAHLEDTYNYFHSESTSEVCQFCLAPCSSKANFYQHVSTYHQDQVANNWKKCDTCAMLFPDLPTLTMHKQSTHKKKGKTYKNSKNSRKICKFCSFQYEDLDHYYDHANAEHTDTVRQSWLQCNKCSKYYPERRSLYQHFRIHRENNGQPQNGASTTWTEYPATPQEPYPPQTTPQCQTSIQSSSNNSQPTSMTNTSQIWSHATPAAPSSAMSETNTCFICQETFTVTQAYYHHANFKHRDILAKTWHLCQVCMWYYPSENAIRTHGCGLLSVNNGLNTPPPKQEQPPNPFGQTTTAFTLYQPTVHRPQGTYSIIGLTPQVTMDEFYAQPSNSVTQAAREYITSQPLSNEKSDFAELKNVTLNGWLETSEPKGQPPISHLIHYPGGYL